MCNLFMKIKHFQLNVSGVGKSCLLLRFSDGSFTTSFITTIGFVYLETVEFLYMETFSIMKKFNELIF